MSDATTIPEIRKEAQQDFINSLTHIFVMAIDYGYEGHSRPMQAFLNEHEAKAALALANANPSNSWKLYLVPLWPQPLPEFIEPARVTVDQAKEA